jgi:hypothetical protein
MESTVENIAEMRNIIKTYKFKSWSSVCDTWLEEILNFTG